MSDNDINKPSNRGKSICDINQFKIIVSRFFNWVSNPFTKHLPIVLLFTFLSGFTPAFYQFYCFDASQYACYIISFCFILSYVATLLLSLIPCKTIRYIIVGVMVVLLLIDSFINVYSIVSLSQCFDSDIATIIFATNSIETKEFLSTQINSQHIILCLIILLISITLVFIEIKKKFVLNKYVASVFFIAVIFSTILYIHNPVGDFPLTNLFKSVYRSQSSSSDLSNHLTNTTIDYQPQIDKPQKIVVVFGESLTRNHLSLYGYPKTTSPGLDSIAKKGDLFVYNNIKSPALSTALSMKYIFTDLTQNENVNQWDSRINAIELINYSGYKTTWISNQSPAGSHNNVGRLLANLCDEKSFVYSVENGHSSTDDILLPTVRNFHEKHHSDTTFTLIHLMGSHPDFSLRYPPQFKKWTHVDYPALPTNQQSTTADYDNTVFFNDYIVSKIISYYNNDDAIIIYFPDHGVDLFVSDPNYAAHGRPGNPISVKVASEIPFIIYTTHTFKKSHQRLENIIFQSNKDKAWVTDNFFYLIADIVGIKSINGTAVNQYSLLHD